MAKANKIRREIVINGVKRWVTGNSEQEYAENLIKALSDGSVENVQFKERKHLFQPYAQKWFEVFSRPNIEAVTATTYERQLKRHIFPVLGEMNIEDILPADVQRIFNGMNGARETKIKTKNVLNMVFQQALEDGLIQRNPLLSKSIRITGRGCKPTEPYSVAQMRFLVQHIGMIERPSDRAYMALQALHPLRLEEVLGLKWMDIDTLGQVINVRRAVTHPQRNQPQVKETKTEASRRQIDLVPQIIPYLQRGRADEFVLGGENPLTYTQTRRMCERIQRDTGFDEPITPRRFRTTILTDIYDATKDITQAQAAAGHTTAAMTLKHYVKGRQERANTAAPIAGIYFD